MIQSAIHSLGWVSLFIACLRNELVKLISFRNSFSILSQLCQGKDQKVFWCLKCLCRQCNTVTLCHRLSRPDVLVLWRTLSSGMWHHVPWKELADGSLHSLFFPEDWDYKFHPKHWFISSGLCSVAYQKPVVFGQDDANPTCLSRQ